MYVEEAVKELSDMAMTDEGIPSELWGNMPVELMSAVTTYNFYRRRGWDNPMDIALSMSGIKRS